ncbi:exodeoxyribonuclease V subunit gamma [Pantoea sp. Nvir]|uniref:exodeoxyribonuclease V subunit gamma n=1 Tax=Pantoea sp. Nvir TaxID=2576760 RepID=UPI00135AE341|nr:exodeoxyribonuclease V subunit gamma [Pantoea sp. Nvir]MXP66407.1 exodeoxyribonuclease V subunit gamma [Pantoea sp. Nvir]
MLHVYHSNKLDVLKILAAAVIEHEPLNDPLSPEIILVQSPGMAQWLRIELAQIFNIVANIEFPLPASFIWNMFMRVLPDIPAESFFNKSSMQWKLMHRLPQLLTQEAFVSLRHYLHDDIDKRKLFQLCSRLADLFDQYLVYRADWLNRWEQGELIKGLGDAQLSQSLLWRDLVNYTELLGQSRWHRANLYAQFIQKLDRAKQTLPNLPKRVFICGISALPPIYLQLLQSLGRHIDIYLLVTNPCRDYWGDIQNYTFLTKLQNHQRRYHNSEEVKDLFYNPLQTYTLFSTQGEQQISNPLLASWGKLGRDNLFLLSEIDEIDEVEAFVDVKEDNLLHAIQHDMLFLQNRAVIGLNAEEVSACSGRKRSLDTNDRSIRVQICHSVQREVEVLQDHLLEMLEADPSLKPNDIIVMVADIDNYAPFIQAVFANAPADRFLPFSISDRRASHTHPAILTFLNLLELPNSRFVAEDVLELLQLPAIANRFSVGEHALRLLRRWVKESGVRWGLGDDSVEELILPVTGQHTWRFGLERMLLGYAMESHYGDWQGILPYDESSGLVGELVGHLAELIMRLDYWCTRLKQPRPLEAWLPLCRDMINDFFHGDMEAEAALLLLEEHWNQNIKYGQGACYQDAVSITLLRDDLLARLDQQRISQRFIAGQINFCTLMPMRSIPFRVVCLLGMNDGIYPRTLPVPSFDLMQQQARKGDRSRRDDDRYLFLEALLSANDCFYISYIGCAIQDNTKRYPSVLVTELLDYIGQSFCLPGDEGKELDESAQNVQQYIQYLNSRMPFAAENFQPQRKYHSFAREWLPAAQGKGEVQVDFMQPLPEPVLKSVSCEQFLRFWSHPVREWFHHRLGVTFGGKEYELSDNEPFVLDGLERYHINTKLLNALVEGKDTQHLFTLYRAAGNLPYGAFGELFWQAQQKKMQEIAAAVIERRNKSETWEVNLQLNGVELTGWIMQVQYDGLLRWRPGILNINDGLQLWLEHLIYCVLCGSGESRMIGRENSHWRFPAIASQEAAIILTRYMQGYKQGISRPLLLLNKSGGAWLTTSYDVKTQQLLLDEVTQIKARNRILQAWAGRYDQEGESGDPYLQRLCRGLNKAWITQITEAAKLWYLPVIQAHQDDER